MKLQRSFKQRLWLQVLNGKAIAYNPYNSASTMQGKCAWQHVGKRG